MTDPLTPEQRETVESIRALLNAGRKTNFMEMKVAVRIALSIIDSLPAPKQYTEAELRAEFERINNTYRLEKEKFGRRVIYENEHVQIEFDGFVSCARFLRVLKEPHA